MTITYSGYNGQNGALGNEFIEFTGRTTTDIKMRVYAYAIGSASVQYKWDRSQSECCRGIEKCPGVPFNKFIKNKELVTIGEIPVGKVNVSIYLKASLDVDVQIYDQSDTEGGKWPEGKAIIGYCETASCNLGWLAGPARQSTRYKGVEYVYSGYNGDGQSLGNEYIEIIGTTNTPLTMKAFGYTAGTSSVTYSWYELDTSANPPTPTPPTPTPPTPTPPTPKPPTPEPPTPKPTTPEPPTPATGDGEGVFTWPKYSQQCFDDAGPPFGDDVEIFGPNGKYHDIGSDQAVLRDDGQCAEPVRDACAKHAKGGAVSAAVAKTAYLEGPLQCGGKGWFCRILPDVPHAGTGEVDWNYNSCNRTEYGDTDGHCHGSDDDDTFYWWVRDHWNRNYGGWLHCCCDWSKTLGVVSRCDYRAPLQPGENEKCRDANEDHDGPGSGFSKGFEAGCPNLGATVLPEPPVSQCWDVLKFAPGKNVDFR